MPVGPVQLRRGFSNLGLARESFGVLDPLFDVPDGVKIFVDFAAIRRADGGGDFLGVLPNHVEDALAIERPLGARLRIEAEIHGAEEPLEDQARIAVRRERRSWVPPREPVHVGAAISGIAIANRARIVQRKFE